VKRPGIALVLSLAALLAASVHSQEGLIAVITVTSVLTLATYAVDYAWYSFFLTPTFVLLSLPHLQDWHFAGVRMMTTVIGAAVALLAMGLLWPEREQVQLGRLLGRGAAADAAYVRAILRFWWRARRRSSGSWGGLRNLASWMPLWPARGSGISSDIGSACCGVSGGPN